MEIDKNITQDDAVTEYVLANHDANATDNSFEKDTHRFYVEMAKAYWTFIWHKWGVEADRLDRNAWRKYIGSKRS